MNDFGICLCDECDVVRDAIASAAPFVRCLQETKLHDVTALKAHTFLPCAFVASFHFLGASYITFVEGTAPAQPGHVGGKAAARAISIGGSRRVMSHWPFGRRVCPIFTRRVSSILLLFVRAAWLSFPEVASLCSWLFFLVLFVYLSFGMVS